MLSVRARDAVAGLRLGNSATSVPKTITATPAHIQLTSGFKNALTMGWRYRDSSLRIPRRGPSWGTEWMATMVCGLLAGEIDALFRVSSGTAFCRPCRHRAAHIRVIVEIRVLRKAHALQRIGADGHLVVHGQFALFTAIESRPGQADYDHDHARVDDVTAVAAGVAAGRADR